MSYFENKMIPITVLEYDDSVNEYGESQQNYTTRESKGFMYQVSTENVDRIDNPMVTYNILTKEPLSENNSIIYNSIIYDIYSTNANGLLLGGLYQSKCRKKL